MSVFRRGIFQPAENYSINTPLITPEDIASDPNVIHNANLRASISSNIVPNSIPIPGITLDVPRKLSIEEQQMYDHYTGLYNKFNADLNMAANTKYIPNTIFGCHVKLMNDGLPEISSVTQDKAKALINSHMFCIVDETELSEYFEPQPGTIVYVQMLDEGKTYGRIVAAQNYSSGIAVAFAGQTADNFKGLVGLVGSGGSFADQCGSKNHGLVVDIPPSQSPKDSVMEGYEDAYFRGVYIGKLKMNSFKGVPVAEKSYAPFVRMFDAAQSAGVTLSLISGFRTMAKQKSLYGNGEKGKFVARPGFSNHQNGMAFDFCYASSKGVGADKCAPQINWLRANAKTFQFCQPMSYEPWHWEYRP